MRNSKRTLLIIKYAFFFESYILPGLFLISIYSLLGFYVEKWPAVTRVFGQIFSGNMREEFLIFASVALSKFFLIVIYSLVVLGLLFRKPLKGRPTMLREIILPVLGTFFYLFYQLIAFIPKEFNFYLLPKSQLLIPIIIGTVLNVIGQGVSILAIFNLRNSFGILVGARETITGGLYRLVRHPIYFGYMLSVIGILFITPRFVYLLLSLLLIFINIYRAMLEERVLAAADPAYRKYSEETPFILPFTKSLS